MQKAPSIAVGPACRSTRKTNYVLQRGPPARHTGRKNTATGQFLRPCRCSLFKGSGRAGEKRRCWPERFRQHGDGCACRLTTLSPPHQVCTVMTCTSKLVPSPHINQNSVHGLSTPTLLGRGWGRQNVETKLAKIHHKVLILIAWRSTPVQILKCSDVCLKLLDC